MEEENKVVTEETTDHTIETHVESPEEKEAREKKENFEKEQVVE